MNSNEYTRNVLLTEHTPDFISLPSDVGPVAVHERLPHMRMLARLQHALWGIASESGELNDMFKKHIIYGAPFDRINAVEEMGDKLWYVAIGLHSIGVSFATAMQCNIEKLLVRYGGKFEKGRALVRDKAKERAAMESIVNAADYLVRNAKDANPAPDITRARNGIAELEKALASMLYAPREGQVNHQHRAAAALNVIAEALGLAGGA